MDSSEELFKGKTFSDLMSDIYHNSRKKDKQIKMLTAQLQDLITTASDATIIVPLIKEYLDIAVKNDDHLVKLAAIVQRYISSTQVISNDSGLLSENEKAELLRVAGESFKDELGEELEVQSKKEIRVEQKVEEAKQKLDSDINGDDE